jgi:hypothetical protein
MPKTLILNVSNDGGPAPARRIVDRSAGTGDEVGDATPAKTIVPECDREALQRSIGVMEADFIRVLVTGGMGTRHNTFQHRSRLLHQAKQRLSQ